MSLNPSGPHPPADSLEFLIGGGEMGARMRAYDWSRTSLGPPHTWPQSLRSALSICLGASFQIAIYWGPDLALLYNDAWSQIAADKHPWVLGKAGREVWPEIWETIGPAFAQVMADGEAIRSKDQLLAMHRRGFTEECYFDYTFSPIRDEAGSVGGIFNIAVETTFRVIGERRTRLLKDVGEITSQARSASEACTLAAKALASDPADLTFCLIYLVDADKPESACLASASLIEPGLAPSPSAIEISDPGTPWPLAEVLSSRSIRLVKHCSTRFGELLPSGPWPELCERALIVPLPSLGADYTGAIVVGISPRLTLDPEYEAFVERVAGVTGAAISNARAYEHERQRANALAELDHAKTLFFSNISHELRTPLTLMLGPIEDILAKPEDQVPPENKELLEVAHRSGLRLQRLVNNLLDFSRIQAGRAQASYQRTDIAALTAELASNFRSAMDRAGLRYAVEAESLSQPVYLDRDMWEKIVLNLLSNAFKYTLEGSVSVRVREENGMAELSVTDTGSGIPASEVPRLFERFHRVEQTRGRTHEGTGIGLALVQELVKLHGGSITVQSVLGQGSTFTVSIPFGARHLPPDQLDESRTVTSALPHSATYVEEALRWLPNKDSAFNTQIPSRSENGSEAVARSRVLLVEDNPDMREYVRRLLSERYDVTTAENGEAALAAALADPPDLVLSDIMMPVLDGFGLLKELRAHPSTREVPVILLSARAGEESSVEGLEAGADDYLIKPFGAKELLARVGAHLALKRERQRAHRRLTQVFSQAPVCIAVFRGRDFVVELANPAYQTLLRGRELVGRPFRDVAPELEEPVWDAFNSVLDTGQPFVANDFYVPYDQDADGLNEDHWFNVVYHPIQEGGGSVSGIIAVLTEVTAQVRARRELERANRELEEFAYVASHDLQEPLRMVNIYTHLILRKLPPGNPALAEYGKYVETGVLRMEKLIEDLLTFSRTVHAEVNPPGVADLSVSITEALSILKIRIEECGAVVSMEALPVVRGDTQQLAQVFQNLLSNALKYRDASRAPEIHVTSRRDGAQWIICVRDNGIGFDQQYAERIFGLFKRLHKDEYPGTGLGLAICQRIVERYGGRMWAESNLGVGSRFCFALQNAEIQ